MRPKIVIVVLLAGLAGLAVIFLLKPAAGRPQPIIAHVPESAATAPKVDDATLQLRPATNHTVATSPNQPKKIAPVATDEAVDTEAMKTQAQIDRLVDLQSNDDDASLQAILKELTNSNKLIRHEAIEATIQFGSRDAIPVLNNLASRTWDPNEKKELLDAVEFLSLPTLIEAKAQAQQEKK